MMRAVLRIVWSSSVLVLCVGAQEHRRPVLEWQEVRVCEGKFRLDCLRRSVRLPRHEAGTVEVIAIDEKPGVGLVGGSHSTGEYWRDAFFAALPKWGGTGLVIQSDKGATLSVWDPHEDRYEKVVLWGRDIQKLDEENEIVYVAWPCHPLGCDFGPRRDVQVSVWGRGDVGPLKARSLVPKVQEALGIEKFRLNLANNPGFWGFFSAVPPMMPAMGILGLQGLRNVSKFSGVLCEPTLSGLGAKCY